MAESTAVLAAICGALLACAPIFVISGRRHAPLRLSDALAGLSDHGRQDAIVGPSLEGGRLERWSASSDPLAEGGEPEISSHPRVARKNPW